MSWDGYVAMIQHVFDAASNSYTVQNVAASGGIFGLDGTKWGATEGFDLTVYDYDVLLDEEGNKKTVNVDEKALFKDVLNGNTRGGEAGLRFGNDKYMFVSQEGKYTRLSKRGGGAIIGKAKTCGVIGTWDTASTDSTGKNQNPGDVMLRIEALVQYLEQQGY